MIQLTKQNMVNRYNRSESTFSGSTKKKQSRKQRKLGFAKHVPKELDTDMLRNTISASFPEATFAKKYQKWQSTEHS